MTEKTGFEILDFNRFPDERGHFQEWFHSDNSSFRPVQGNKSVSKKDVIRGIHLSRPGVNQKKLITCVTGSILDVIVNLRIGDENFGKFHSVELSSDESKSIFIDSGMGHAFLALEQNTTVVYLTDTFYSAEIEISLNILDPDIGIEWEVKNPIISEKDLKAISLRDFKARYTSNYTN